MATHIEALERGGYSAYGQAWSDDRCRIIYIQADRNEAHLITVTFPSAIDTVTIQEGGSSSDPVIDNATFSATLTDLGGFGFIEYLVTLETGEVRTLRIAAAPAYALRQQGYGYGWGI